VGVVGRSGSGKTTFSRLVLRLVEPTSGLVRLGGVPIADIPIADLRRRVALVSQEVELFSGSIRDNVTLFDDDVRDEAVEDALRAVGLEGLVTAGIDRGLGAAGAGLSSGEAQLLSLARVWLRDPDLLVLDEATARIDPATERQIEAAVARLIVGRTTLIIAHRLSTLRTVDDIVVFERGRIVEAGPRADLVGDDDSHFAQLLAMALEDDDAGAPADEEWSETAGPASDRVDEVVR
jgi:ABC-type multidrug transport system fused ATPase/permease subunit